MDISTIVNIILCVLSFLLAVISVVTVIITLKQNSKMIEESSRAVISIYGESIILLCHEKFWSFSCSHHQI